jgi:hypothetical protein
MVADLVEATLVPSGPSCSLLDGVQLRRSHGALRTQAGQQSSASVLLGSTVSQQFTPTSSFPAGHWHSRPPVIVEIRQALAQAGVVESNR